MIEFEKQWGCGMLSGSPTSFDSGASPKEAAQHIWRAALEMILEDIALADKLGFEPVDILIQIEKKLREELEDEGNQ